MTASLKLQRLESKISKLDSQKQDLLKQRLDETAELMSKLNLANLNDKLLVGALLFIQERITRGDPMTEDWHQAGERFLRKNRANRKSSSKKTSQTFAADQP